MKKLQMGGLFTRALATAAVAFMAAIPVAKAVPFASCVTNTGGTISFYLNESGGSVTVTYGDGTTNANYNGVTTGTNLAAGVQTGFTLPGTNTLYSISVQKNGSGSPSLIASHTISNTRGVVANTIPTSAAFGRVYDVQANVGVWLMNSDLSLNKATAQTGGIGFPFGNASTTTASPLWVSVAPDGSVLVTDESLANSAIYQMAPDFSSGQLFLGPVGTNSQTVHGVIISAGILTGSIAGSNAKLYTVDGDIGGGGLIQVYNINGSSLPYANPPDAQGPQISYPLPEQSLGGNEYIGLTVGPPPNNYIYASTYRSAPGSANFVTVTDSTGTNVLWDSANLFSPGNYGTPPTGDWFYQTATAGANSSGPIGLGGTSAVSPDGKYFCGCAVNSYFVICALTNGIPDVSTIFTYLPPGVNGTSQQNGRGFGWDAADNLIMSSSGLGSVTTYSLGITATAVTTGNLTGTTGFTLTQPSTVVSVVATQPNASQGGVNGTVGTPVSGTFSIYRFSTNGYGSAQTVNYVMGGTATTAGGVYTISGGTTNSATILAGQTNVIVTITPTTANVPRLTTTAILNLAGGAGYSVAAPFSDTVFIQNTSSQQIVLGTNAPSMYRAYSNDFASFIVTRLGDTNAPSYTVNTFVAAGGTAIQGTDYTAPTNITFNPGDLAYTNQIFPLVGGQPPVDTTNPTYVGNLTALIGVSAGTGYAAATNKATLTSIDNADPPAPVLWSNPLTSASDSNNWVITAANGNMNADTNDYEVTFGYDLTSANPNYGFNGLAEGVVGFPPSGATTCLRITCNKDITVVGCNGGVNAFPTNAPMFSGNYAVRFYMNIVQGSLAGSATEGPLFGINHLSLGVTTNWFTGSGFTSYATNNSIVLNQWADDGVWFWVDGSSGGDGDGDFVQFTGINHTFPNTGFSPTFQGLFAPNFVNNFKNPAPFNTYLSAGIPANESPNAAVNLASTPANVWDDVEIKQINNIVTMSINKTPILVYTNISGWVSGLPMLGYNDPFNSVQDEDSAAYFSDIRVVQIGPPSITQITDVGGTVTIRFVTQDGDDTTSSYTLLSSGTTGSALHVDTVVTGATFSQLSSGAFQVTVPTPATQAVFYRLKHN